MAMTALADSPTEAEQRRALARHRAVATALLLAMGAAFAALTASGAGGFWADLARAGTEAALVGGLADWFAVTALFRRPLGLPIPHTAVIPASKDRIGAGLGGFLEKHILEPELVAARLRAAAVSRRLALWLAEPHNAALVVDRLAVALAFLLRSLGDEAMRRLVYRTLRRQLRETDLAPALASMIDILRRNEAHQDLFDRAVAAARAYLIANREHIFALVEARSRWWVPKRVDRRVAEAIADGLLEYLEQLLRRDHDARASFDAAFARLAEDLRRNPVYRQRVERMRDQILDTPQVRDYVDTLWRGLRTELEQGLAEPDSRLRRMLTGLLAAAGRTIADDPSVQERMDRRIEEVTMTLVVPWRRDIGRFVADVVRGWEAQTMVERIELAVGKDLQYIRLNGTLVGAAVGCFIFLATELLA